MHIKQPGRSGGAERYVDELIRWLNRGGHDCLFLVGEGQAKGGGTGVDPIAANTMYDELFDRGLSAALAAVQRWRPDFVYVNSLTNPEWEVALQSVADCGRFIHSYEGDCVNGARFHTRPQVTVCQQAFGWRCWPRYFWSGCGQNNLPITRGRIEVLRDGYRREKLRRTAFKGYRAVFVMSE
ncbi:MAG: hypothetical protein J6386_13160 [Candidatus Synoicihabitans palmerolidicus]|nr:hypothetical protein [Candidatus Synoicihabitans palmerolidicus]